MPGQQVLPSTPGTALPAAAMVANLCRPMQLDPMFQQLDASPGVRIVREVRLLPIVVIDFYARNAR